MRPANSPSVGAVPLEHVVAIVPLAGLGEACDRILISGDAVVTIRLNSLWGVLVRKRGLSGPPWYTSWNWRAAKESVPKLAGLEPTVLATGHGKPLTGLETAKELRDFADQFSGRR